MDTHTRRAFVRSLELEDLSGWSLALDEASAHELAGYSRIVSPGYSRFVSPGYSRIVSPTPESKDLAESEDLAGSSSPVSPTPNSEGLVVAGSLVSFTSKVEGQQKADVLDSCLLAQLASTKKYNRNTDPDKWYEFYVDVLGHLGWVLQSLKFSKYNSSETQFKMSDVLLKMLTTLVKGDKEVIEVVEQTLQQLEKSPGSLTLYSSNSSEGKQGNYQIWPCTVDESNQVVAAFNGYKFDARKVDKTFLFFPYSAREINLYYSTQVFTLNEGVYAQLREEVRKKLGKSGQDYVSNLRI